MIRKGDTLITDPAETGAFARRFAAEYEGSACPPTCGECGGITCYIVENMTDKGGWRFVRPNVTLTVRALGLSAIVDRTTKVAYIPVTLCNGCDG